MTAPESVPDLQGVDVRVGDRIAYAATDGRSGGLRLGRVLAIVEAQQADWRGELDVKLRVEVEASTGYGAPDRPTLIRAEFKRFVKLA